MRYLFLNLKRFDIPAEFGGVNRIAPIEEWGKYIVENTQGKLKEFVSDDVQIIQFFPEAHILSAKNAISEDSQIKLGCQGVYRMDTAIGGNFGAYTTNLPAAAASALGCEYVIIGHSEERNDIGGILAEAGVHALDAENRILNKEIKHAINRGLKVLYCIGETSEEQVVWEQTLGRQLSIGLNEIDLSKVVIGYEPVWSIGPGKTPADKPYITKIARFIKSSANEIAVVYGGGLKTDNAEMLSSISEINGGLIALTRFQGSIGFYPDEYVEIIRTYLRQ